MADLYFRAPLTMDNYDGRVSCKNQEEFYLDKMENLFSGYPRLGVPREPSKIMKGIFVGTTADAENLDLLYRLGITHILFCSTRRRPLYNRTGKTVQSFQKGVKSYMHVNQDENDDYDIRNHFLICFEWMWNARKGGGQILICGDGVSVPGALCVGYMMERGAYLLQASKILKETRRTGICNSAFMRQLVKYAQDKGLLDPKPEKYITTRYGTGRDRYRLNSVHLPEIQIVQDKYKYMRKDYGKPEEYCHA